MRTAFLFAFEALTLAATASRANTHPKKPLREIANGKRVTPMKAPELRKIERKRADP